MGGTSTQNPEFVWIGFGLPVRVDAGAPTPTQHDGQWTAGKVLNNGRHQLSSTWLTVISRVRTRWTSFTMSVLSR